MPWTDGRAPDTVTELADTRAGEPMAAGANNGCAPLMVIESSAAIVARTVSPAPLRDTATNRRQMRSLQQPTQFERPGRRAALQRPARLVVHELVGT